MVKIITHELMIFIKFHEDRTKNVDFLLMPIFECGPFSYSKHSRLSKNEKKSKSMDDEPTQGEKALLGGP